MPYLSAEDVKTKRNLIKKAFPAYKFSITREHHSTISVYITEAPINLLTNDEHRGYEQVNHFYIKEHYAETPRIRDILSKIYKIAKEGNRIISEDGDYGFIPNFYINISIGKWDKPFKINQ